MVFGGYAETKMAATEKKNTRETPTRIGACKQAREVLNLETNEAKTQMEN